MEKAGVRPLGLLEKLYTARHTLDFYYSVSTVNTYRSDTSYNRQQLGIIITTALAQVVQKHAALCCGIHGQDTRNPSFVLVSNIDLAQQLAFRTLHSGATIMTHLQIEHNEAWSAQETTPPWKVIVFQSENGESNVLDIAFLYHHSLGDGLSGVAFHSSLLRALTDVSLSQLPSQPTWQVNVAPPLSLTPPIEELLNFKTSWSFLGSQVLQEYGPPALFGRRSEPYTAMSCQSLDELPFRTMLRLIEIDASTIKALLEKGKSKQSAITALLSVVIARSLALEIPTAGAFLSQIPYTMRRISGTDYETMANQTSTVEIGFEKEVLDTFRDPAENVADPIWDRTATDSAVLQEKIADCLNNNPVGLLRYISDHHEFYRKKLGKKREATWEVSNIGPVQSRVPNRDTWKIERAIFSQGAAIVGPAFQANVASVRDGPMTIAFSWQQNVIEESVMTNIIKSFESTLKMLAGS